MDFIKETVESGFANSNKVLRIAYWLDNIGNAIYLINIFRNAIGIK